MLRGFMAGVTVTVAIVLLAGYAGIVTGTLVPANADAKPGKFEEWAAKTSLRASVRRAATPAAIPLAASDRNLLAGIKLYGENCAVCHGTAGGVKSETKIAKGLYQKPPQLGGKHGVEDDPGGETFWKIKHGIRLTGMPAFGSTLSDAQIWQMSLFLKQMDRLPPVPERAWQAMRTP
jgi:mono/diheme cytochrome c family protein